MAEDAGPLSSKAFISEHEATPQDVARKLEPCGLQAAFPKGGSGTFWNAKTIFALSTRPLWINTQAHG